MRGRGGYTARDERCGHALLSDRQRWSWPPPLPLPPGIDRQRWSWPDRSVSGYMHCCLTNCSFAGARSIGSGKQAARRRAGRPQVVDASFAGLPVRLFVGFGNVRGAALVLFCSRHGHERRLHFGPWPYVRAVDEALSEAGRCARLIRSVHNFMCTILRARCISEPQANKVRNQLVAHLSMLLNHKPERKVTRPHETSGTTEVICSYTVKLNQIRS
jgi:hypothetical protein